MDVLKIVLVSILEVLGELTRRLGQHDLCEKCQACQVKVREAEDSEKEGG